MPPTIAAVVSIPCGPARASIVVGRLAWSKIVPASSRSSAVQDGIAVIAGI